MEKCVFSGVCTALVTPFTNGSVNYPMAEQLLRRQMQAGIQAVVLAGTTGESPTLSDAEKITLFSRCKKYAGGYCKIIAGTGTNDTARTVQLSQAAEAAGADALLVVSPYYNKATPEGLYLHYRIVAESVNIPVILYNVPTRTGVDIPTEVYRRLSEIPNIAGVKEASTDIKKVADTICTCGESFYVWSGNDDMAVPVISLGGKGVVSVLSNIRPGETEAMCQAALNGDFKTASRLSCRMLPLMKALFSEINPIPVKTALKHLGYDCGSCRLPLTGPKPETVEAIRKLLI